MRHELGADRGGKAQAGSHDMLEDVLTSHILIRAQYFVLKLMTDRSKEF